MLKNIFKEKYFDIVLGATLSVNSQIEHSLNQFFKRLIRKSIVFDVSKYLKIKYFEIV